MWYRFRKGLKLAVHRDEGHFPERSPRIRARAKAHLIQRPRPTVPIRIAGHYIARLVNLKNGSYQLMDGVVKLFGPEQQFYTSWKSECLKPIPRIGCGNRSRQQLHFEAKPWSRAPSIENNSLVR